VDTLEREEMVYVCELIYNCACSRVFALERETEIKCMQIVTSNSIFFLGIKAKSTFDYKYFVCLFTKCLSIIHHLRLKDELLIFLLEASWNLRFDDNDAFIPGVAILF